MTMYSLRFTVPIPSNAYRIIAKKIGRREIDLNAGLEESGGKSRNISYKTKQQPIMRTVTASMENGTRYLRSRIMPKGRTTTVTIRMYRRESRRKPVLSSTT